MPRKQLPRRSDDEWFRLITECHQSGMSDSHWCKLNNIPQSSMCSAIRRLRDKSYALPVNKPITDTNLNLSSVQDVVKIDITQDTVPATYDAVPNTAPAVTASTFFDNSHTIEIIAGNTTLRISNSANPDLLKLVLGSMTGGLLC